MPDGKYLSARRPLTNQRLSRVCWTIIWSSCKHKWNVLKELLCDIETVRKSGCVKKPERGFGRVVSSLFSGFGLGFGEFF